MNGDEVRAALQASMGLHNAAKGNRQGRPSDWREMLTEAKRLRVEAHWADPGHTAQAWKDEEGKAGPDTHRTLMDWYAEKGIV